MNLGLVYSALVENNSQAIEELDDVFEENGLERCKNKYKLYVIISNSITSIVRLNVKHLTPRYFNSIEARTCFIEGIQSVLDGLSSSYIFLIGLTLEEIEEKRRTYLLHQGYEIPKNSISDVSFLFDIINIYR